MAKFDEIFLKRRLNSQVAGGFTMLDAVAGPADGSGKVTMFFQAGTPADMLQAGAGLEISETRSIGDAPVLSCQVNNDNGTVRLQFGDVPVLVEPSPPETNLFADLNVIFAVRNGETAQVVAKWLEYHVAHHDLQAALILDRAQPGNDQQFVNQLQILSKKIIGLQCVVLLESDVPLGKPDLPPEAHPFNVPGAPGKDRMQLPEPDPWAAPLAEMALFELVRARFLADARAVANIEVHDLLCKSSGPNMFDRAVAAPQGVVRLDGAQVYPWRIRKGDAAAFGDHICVQFDATTTRARWCVAPSQTPDNTVWRPIRIVGAEPDMADVNRFWRHMALRHSAASISKIVPKTSLIENAELVAQAKKIHGHKPVRVPEIKLDKAKKSGANSRITIVTTMKNEGPFILEWIAYHRAIGVTDFLIYTNDCTDGTDTLLDVLQDKGIVQHRQNPYKSSQQKPQHAALEAADKEAVVQNADWIICMDVDEFINIHVGNGRLNDLFAAVGDANMISLTWRLFGNGDEHLFKDELICERFTNCAPEMVRKPHQAWGFKTLFRNQGIFKKMGVHRPKGLNPQLWGDINWVNGSGAKMPESIYRNGWRSTARTFGYGLVSLNHYAVRSAESFLVKRDRGRVNHVDRDQGLSYWFRMNNNAESDTSIQNKLPLLHAELTQFMAEPGIAEIHQHTVEKHREKIGELQTTDAYSTFYRELVGARMQRLSRMHSNFGANVFLMGPGVVPDEVWENDVPDDFFFTVERGETNH